jgi:hypothetical protein
MSSQIKKQKGKSSPKGRGRVTRKTNRGPTILRVPGQQFQSDGERVKLKYTDQYIATQSATAGTLSNLVYKLNAIHNVNSTATAGLPQGFAEMFGKFQKVRVLGSQIRWSLRNMQGGGTFGNLGALGAAPTNSALYAAVTYPAPPGIVTPTDLAGAAVQKYASKRFDWPRERPIIVGAYEPTQINPRELFRGSHSMTMSKLTGDPDVSQASYVHTSTTDPTQLALWIISFQDLLSDAAAKGVWLSETEITYDCHFFDRVNIEDALVGRRAISALPLDVPSVRRAAVEEKTPPQRTSDIQDIEDLDVSPLSHPLPGGYELVKRKSLAVLSARR